MRGERRGARERRTEARPPRLQAGSAAACLSTPRMRGLRPSLRGCWAIRPPASVAPVHAHNGIAMADHWRWAGYDGVPQTPRHAVACGPSTTAEQLSECQEVGAYEVRWGGRAQSLRNKRRGSSQPPPPFPRPTPLISRPCRLQGGEHDLRHAGNLLLGEARVHGERDDLGRQLLRHRQLRHHAKHLPACG